MSTRGAGIGVGPFSVGASNREMQGCVGALLILGIIAFLAVWPYYLGKWVAGLFGAAPASDAQFITGWVFEGVYLAVIAVVLTIAYTQAVARILVTALGVCLAPLVTGGEVAPLPADENEFWVRVLMIAALTVAMNFFTLGVVIAVEGTIALAVVSLLLNGFFLYIASPPVLESDLPDWDAGTFGWVVLVATVIAVGQALASAAIASLQE